MCSSDLIKKRPKAEGTTRIQGEFGIGLLSCRMVGEELALTSADADAKTAHDMPRCTSDPAANLRSTKSSGFAFNVGEASEP